MNDLLVAWQLFQDAWITALLLALLLSLLGLPFLARDQIFTGAAAAEAAVLGVVIGIVGHLGAVAGTLCGAVLAVLAVAICARAFADPRRSGEAMAGWIFLLGGGLSVLLLAHDPHGVQQTAQILLSTLIGADRTDLWISLVALLCTIFVLIRKRQVLALVITDPAHARALGLNVGGWSMAIGLVTGLAIAYAIRTAGLMFTFGMLVLPGLAAARAGSGLRATVVLTPPLAACAAIAGIMLSHGADTPPGQTIVVIGCALVVLAAPLRRLRRNQAAITP